MIVEKIAGEASLDILSVKCNFDTQLTGDQVELVRMTFYFHLIMYLFTDDMRVKKNETVEVLT